MGSMIDKVNARNPSEMTREEILDEISQIGNYTDREMKLRKALNSKKLGGLPK